MGKRRQLVLLLFGALALAGLYQALRNLPVLTGCSFYADCPAAPPAHTGNADVGPDRTD